MTISIAAQADKRRVIPTAAIVQLPFGPPRLMIVILAANVRILVLGFAGKIPQHKAKNHFLFAWLCICVYAATRIAVFGIGQITH